MACVILPSETARLVYGYLVKENLNDIAHQFLESSPYLMDCCQIVKSGYQFNTKLMNKDLPELLQEYSVIHNLVNNKIGSLSKTSLLYKRIKLSCESLPEILELILFWKFKITKAEKNSSISEKTEKNSHDQGVNSSGEYSSFSEGTDLKENGSDAIKKVSNSTQKENIFSNDQNKYTCDTYTLNKNIEEEEVNSIQNQKIEHSVKKETENTKNTFYMSLQDTELLDTPDKSKTNCVNSNCTSDSYNKDNISKSNNNDNNINSNNNCNATPTTTSENCMPESSFNSGANVLMVDMNPQCQNFTESHMPSSSLVSNEEPNRFENPIKIVEMQEEHQNENQSLDVFSKPLQEAEGNMNLGSSSVVFVSPDVGNVQINQEQSQIIVIPFDYYKTQDCLQNNVEVNDNKELGLIQSEVVNQQENNIIFQEETPNPNNTPLFSERTDIRSAVDENIVTENDFLKNRHLMYNLEKELYKPELPQQQLLKDPKENLSQPTASAPLILVPQTMPSWSSRYRTILPKKKPASQVHPVVVVHPLLENNKDLTKMKSCGPEIFKAKKDTKCNRKVKKRVSPQKTKSKEIKDEVNSNKPAKAVVENKYIRELKSDSSENTVTSSKENKSEKTNEEKENLEKAENKKNETPVFVTKRNSKRLSLSTPRRKSHIRALEFETPPKNNEEPKKSKTSPKVKVEQVKVERKSVRNTLFKSPIPEESNKSIIVKENTKATESIEPLNELSIPIATRSPNTKLSDAWENLTGVGCVIGQSDSPSKKMWDADLRGFILENSPEDEPFEKKRIRKPEKSQKDNRKSTKKKVAPPKRIKPVSSTISPSKISLTAKRNTYSINGNEGSPIRTIIDELKLVTPLKDIETIRPTEETPLTKLLRENINTIDIDLSMINTPSFPPTPSILITPDLDDVSMPGPNYYSPLKDCSKDKIVKITDYFRVETEKDNKKESKEMHEKVIDDLVSKAKEIIGLGKEAQEENTMKRRPSGKILSMVKIQMLTQCDKKLMENIPINEEANFSNSLTNQTGPEEVDEKTPKKTNLKVELEEKRKRALKKIKVVKENLNQPKRKVIKQGKSRRRAGTATKSDKSKSDISDAKDTEEIQQTPIKTDSEILHSTPYSKNKSAKTSPDKKLNDKILDDIRQKFPPFEKDGEKYRELNEKSRKKLHYVENFLKLTEITKFLHEFTEGQPPKLLLKPSLRRFFYVFYKWLKHPHKRELNASPETSATLREYLLLFDKVYLGLNHKNKRGKNDSDILENCEMTSDAFRDNSDRKRLMSDDDDRQSRKRGNEKRNNEDVEDGVVSTLPLKKRKSTVQQVENKTASSKEKGNLKNISENTSQTQNFLQDIDVDRFLSQIHGQDTR